jgi:hypothetical protein
VESQISAAATSSGFTVDLWEEGRAHPTWGQHGGVSPLGTRADSRRRIPGASAQRRRTMLRRCSRAVDALGRHSEFGVPPQRGCSTTVPGAGAPSAWACRSIFTKASASPCMMTRPSGPRRPRAAELAAADALHGHCPSGGPLPNGTSSRATSRAAGGSSYHSARRRGSQRVGRPIEVHESQGLPDRSCRASPGMITTASSQDVQRSLPPPMRSTATAHSSPLEIVLARIGCRRRGVFRPQCPAQGPGAHAFCRSIFWKAKTSPGKITTASDHVAPVHRSLPPSTRSTVTVNLSPFASVWRAPVSPNCLVTFVDASLLTKFP